MRMGSIDEFPEGLVEAVHVVSVSENVINGWGAG